MKLWFAAAGNQAGKSRVCLLGFVESFLSGCSECIVSLAVITWKLLVGNEGLKPIEGPVCSG